MSLSSVLHCKQSTMLGDYEPLIGQGHARFSTSACLLSVKSSHAKRYTPRATMYTTSTSLLEVVYIVVLPYFVISYDLVHTAIANQYVHY